MCTCVGEGEGGREKNIAVRSYYFKDGTELVVFDYAKIGSFQQFSVVVTSLKLLQ